MSLTVPKLLENAHCS